MVMPGDNVEMVCDMYNSLALESGQRFNVREGGRTVCYFAHFSPYIQHFQVLDSDGGVMLLGLPI